MNEIGKYIQKLADSGDEIYAQVCRVLSVDRGERTCEVAPLNGSAGIPGVRLQADLNSNTGVLVVPVVGSNVLVNFLNKNAGFVALCSEVEDVQLRGNELGGLIKVEDLVDRLNSIEKAFNQHVHIASGSPTATPVKPDQTPLVLIKTNKSQIENTKVLHG
jgi:hypothetical protein